MRKGGIFFSLVSMLFSRALAFVGQFKGTGKRTVFGINFASGWILDDFSRYVEKKVLLELEGTLGGI